MEINHFGHEHPLILKDMRKGKGKCRGCEERISASEAAYECGKCVDLCVDYFLHKTCGELPSELNYPKHIHAHSLVLLSKAPYDFSGGFVCDVCGESFRGFTYHCSLCKFDLDISCAVWLRGTDMNHFLHKHPLILKEDVRENNKICRGCDETILPWGPAYECEECSNYILHKRCGEVPREMKHPKHDEHTLILLPYSKREFLCNECGVNLRGFSYHCSLCEFNLDISCAVWPWERGMEIHHFSHQHPLILNRSGEAEFKSRMPCCGYDRSSSVYGREMAFRCGECEDDGGFILHKECAQLPREIMHPSHYDQDPLILQTSIKINCNGCRGSPSGLMYYCSPCQFAVHIKCAMKDNYIICASRKDRNLRHKGHPQHSLILQPREALLLCNACGLKKEDCFYTCSSCPFMIHRSCALLPETNKCKPHDCDLTLSYGFPSDYKNFKYLCDVCRKRIYDWYWIYYCGDCRYFVHLGCMTTEIEVHSDDDDLFDDASFEKKLLKVLLYDDLLHLPAIDISKELIGRFLLRKNSLAHIQPQIEHFGHKHHPLILFRELPNDIDEDEEILCDGCVEPISADHPYYYYCVECSYFLHLSCAKLPNKLQHPSHQRHSLTLGCHQKFYDSFWCNKCYSDTNGFFFKCETCDDFYLDVKCAAMPTIIEHKNHNHPLFRFDDYLQKECNACGRGTGFCDFGCESCEFCLHDRCAMFPGEVRHRFDPHPLLLRFPPYKDHPEIFMCAICEKEIHPKHWLYHCSECDNSFHPLCVPRLISFQRVKFGGILKVSSHPHPLKFVQEPRVRNNCNHCFGKRYWERMLFECEDCRFSLCLECVRKIS